MFIKLLKGREIERESTLERERGRGGREKGIKKE